MRETETGPSPGAPYMSPLVKQDLARLDKDGESRRSAMNSLKQFVENLDPGSMPRFLAQVSESRDQGSSRSYAISLYEEVARVHGKLIIPHISRVMATVTRSLSSSGSSPQLHQACAKVVSAVARFSVEEGSPEQVDGILRDLCNPLLSVLAGRLEPLAAGAAVCLQALVECEKWKYASDEIVNETCLRTTVALGEKITRTVAHMQLARSLATTNPSFFDSYGVALLRSGSEVLRQTSASGTWQQKACAARLLQAVLPIVDKATLASELELVIEVLDDCKHDRMAHVRAAVSEALKTAKVLSSHDGRVSSDGLSCDSRPSSDVSSRSGQGRKQGRRRPTIPGSSNPHPSLRGETMGCNQQSSDTDGSFFVMPSRRDGRAYTYSENSAITAHRQQEGADILVEGVSSNGTILDIEAEIDTDSNQGLLTKESRYNEVGDRRNDILGSVPSSRFLHRETSPTGLTRQSVCELEGSATDSTNQSVGIHAHGVDGYHHASSGVFVGHDCKENLDYLSERQSRHSSLPNFWNPVDTSGPQKRRALITGEDFLPFSTPRRLVRSLQSNLSSPLGFGPPKNKVTKSLHEGGNMADMDLENSSEAGWSVRDNPIASDDSLKTDSEGKDRDQQGNAFKQMVTDSGTRQSSKGYDPKIGPTEDCEKLSTESVNAAESCFCFGTTKDPEHKSFTDNAEVLNNELDHFCFSPAQCQGGLLSMVKEHCPSQCTCGGRTSNGTHLIGGGDHPVARDEHDFEMFWTSETLKDRTVVALGKSFQHFLGHVFGKMVRSAQACTEALLTGFLLFILAVPFAMVMSKILRSHLDRPGLIPT